MFYADSSFLASLYLPDANTENGQCFPETGADARGLHPLQSRRELHNALRNMVARDEAKSAQVARAFFSWKTTLNDGLLVARTLDQTKLLNLAERFSARHAGETCHSLRRSAPRRQRPHPEPQDLPDLRPPAKSLSVSSHRPHHQTVTETRKQAPLCAVVIRLLFLGSIHLSSEIQPLRIHVIGQFLP